MTGSPCRVTGRTTNCRPRASQTRPSELRELEDELCRLTGRPRRPCRRRPLRATGRGSRPVGPQQAGEANRPRRPGRRPDGVRHRARPPHRVGRAAQHERSEHAGRDRAPTCRGTVACRQHQHRSGRAPCTGARRPDRQRPRAHRIRRGFDREPRRDRSSSPPPPSTQFVRASPRRRRSTSPVPRSAGSEATASPSSPWSTSTRRPSSSCPGQRSCVAIVTTRSRCALLDATNRRLARAERGRASG